jgi:hypothetical protein
MKNETLQQLFKRTVSENLLKVIFVKPETNNTVCTEDALLKIMNADNGIKVQSVSLPIEHQLYSLKTEENFLSWMQNIIHSQHSAFYKINTKYKEDAEQVSWRNNKIQNQRYLETNGR